MVVSMVIPLVVTVGRMNTKPLAQDTFGSWNRKDQKYKDRSDNGSPAFVKKFIDSFHNLLLTSEIQSGRPSRNEKKYSVFRSPLDIRSSDNNKNGKDKGVDRNMKSKIDKTMD